MTSIIRISVFATLLLAFVLLPIIGEGEGKKKEKIKVQTKTVEE